MSTLTLTDTTTPDTTTPGTTLAVTQPNVARAEAIKFRSVRSNVIGLASAGIALLLLGMLFSSLAGSGQAGPPESQGADALSTAFGGMNLSQLILGIVGAVFVAGEYATGMIRSMFAAVADRVPVLRAKAIVVGGASWVVMTVAAFATFFAGTAMYAGDGVVNSLSDPGVLRAVLGTGVYGAGVALIGVALGFLLRSTAAAIGTLVGTLMIAPVLVRLLPDSIGDTLYKFLPSGAGSAFTSVTSTTDVLSPAAGFAVFACWVIGLLVAAAVMLRRRDA